MKRNTRSTGARRRKVQPQKWKLLPDVKKLHRDPEWEALESQLVAHCNLHLPPFEE